MELLASALTAIGTAATTTLPETLTALLPEAATTLPEVASTVEAVAPEVATAAETVAPEVATAAETTLPEAVSTTAETVAPEVTDASQGILNANPNAALDTSMGPGNMGATNITPTTGSIGPDYGQLGQTGVDTTAPSAEAANIGPNFANAGGYTAPAADTASGGIGSYFDKGWKSASDLFGSVEDKLGKGADWIEAHPKSSMLAGVLGAKVLDKAFQQDIPKPEKYKGILSKYHLSPSYAGTTAVPNYYTPTYAAQGGIMNLAMGGPATTPQPGQMYPQSQQEHTQFATPTQMPTSAEVINSGYEPQTNPYTGEQPLRMAFGGTTTRTEEVNPILAVARELGKKPEIREPASLGYDVNEDTDADTRYQDAWTAAGTRNRKTAMLAKPTILKAQPLNFMPQNPQLANAEQEAIQAASGGIMGYNLGGYAAGGRQPRLLKGPGDGMSDNIPATIAGRQPARLADGEFVVPADVVSHLGNGSTDAGAKKLHGMMDKVRVARTGKKAQGTEINPDKYMPA